MGKFVTGNGQYVVYANSKEEAGQILLQELDRVDAIRAKMANLLTQDGTALQNFLGNMSEENLHIHFNDSTSLIYDKPENATIKGEVRHQRHPDGTSVLDDNGDFKYELAYRYTEIQGHNADFRLAHEMGHLMLNPSNPRRYILDNETNTRHISGLIRQTAEGQFYGEEMQENVINLLAQLAIRGEHSADDIIRGKVDVAEFNSYKKCDDLIKLLVVSMRNDFDNEISFEQLMKQKIDSLLELPDGSREPANTFFYGILNDSSIIQKEFDKYMGEGAWKDLNDAFSQLHDRNISQARFKNIFKQAQRLIYEFANIRFQDKYKEAVARNGSNIPSLDNKIKMINEMTGLEQIQFLLKQKIAQLLRRSDMLMKVPFVEKFVNRQLNVLPSDSQVRGSSVNSPRKIFIDGLSKNGEYRNLLQIQRSSDPEKIANMQRRKKYKRHVGDKEDKMV